MDRMERVDILEEKLEEYLGKEELLLAMQKALNYDTKEDIYNYIARMYNIDNN